MQNYFYNELNKNTLEALKNGTAFFMKSGEPQIPLIYNSFTGSPVTGANYFNLKLSNDLNGTAHTEYVRMNDVLASKMDWISKLSPENKLKGTLYQETNSPQAYSFVMPTAELHQDIFRDNSSQNRPGEPRQNYVPFQSNNANMNNFADFVQEQFTNAINASFTATPFKSNINENETDSFKSMLIDSITKNKDFMTEIANRAYQNVMDYHYVPFDKKSFIEKARVENSHEFNQLSAAIASHVEDIYTAKKPSFNREFNELAQPLIINIENLHMDNSNRKTIIGKETTEFVKEKIMQDKPASILADVFAGTFVEKAIKIAKVGKKIFAGIALACALINPDISHAEQNTMDQAAPSAITSTISRDEFQKNTTLNQTAQFVQKVAEKIGGGIDLSSGDQSNIFIKIAGNIINAQELKGNTTLRTSHDNGNSQSLFTRLNQTINSNPHVLDQAISQFRNNQNQKVFSGASSRR